MRVGYVGRDRMESIMDSIIYNAVTSGCPGEHVRFLRALRAKLLPPWRNKRKSDIEVAQFKMSCIPLLQKLARKLHRTPTAKDVIAAARAKECPTKSVIQKRFGTLEAAMLAAGLEPRKPGQRTEFTTKRDPATRKHPGSYRRLRTRGWVA